MALTHFGPSRPRFGSFITLCEASRGLVACKRGAWGLSQLLILHEACRCLVVCKRGIWGLRRFRRIWSEKITRKKRFPLRQKKDASSAYLFFIGSPSWYPFRVPTSVYIEIICRGVGCRAPPPPPTTPRFFLARPYLRPIDPKSKFFLITG